MNKIKEFLQENKVEMGLFIAYLLYIVAAKLMGSDYTDVSLLLLAGFCSAWVMGSYIGNHFIPISYIKWFGILCTVAWLVPLLGVFVSSITVAIEKKEAGIKKVYSNYAYLGIVLIVVDTVLYNFGIYTGVSAYLYTAVCLFLYLVERIWFGHIDY